MVQLGEKDQGCKMISGLKKNTQKLASLVTKARYEQKNSNVNLKKGFENYKDLSKIYQNFRNKIDGINKKKYLVAVSGGPDSLALAALTKAYSYQNKTKFYYALVNHNIRKNSLQEAVQVKNLLKKKQIRLKIFSNKKKIIKNIQAEAKISDMKYLQIIAKRTV